MTGILITVRIKLLFLADRLAWGRAWHKALALRCFWFGSDRNLTKRRSRRGCSKHTHRVPSGKVFYPGRCRLTKNGKHNKSGRYIKFVSYNMEFTLNSIDSVVSTTPTSPREGVGPFFFFFSSPSAHAHAQGVYPLTFSPPVYSQDYALHGQILTELGDDVRQLSIDCRSGTAALPARPGIDGAVYVWTARQGRTSLGGRVRAIK